MEPGVAIKLEHVSKKYCKSLTRSMMYGLLDILRNFVGRSSHSERIRKGEFWAVDDVSFKVNKGEVLGIIGPNGSGKTTLMKMISGVVWPDKGRVSVRGRVGALIAVGAGFHPMLTGRENIYFNGAILGMSKREIEEKFEEIVEFADIGNFLDTPVKNYSSGMFVRLGFAVAAHCDQDVLLVDEVLSVGDGAFQAKCIKKMNEISEKGTTIVFVSHNLLTVGRFCNTGICLIDGKIVSSGEVNQVIHDYQRIMLDMEENRGLLSGIPGMPYCTKEVEITDVKYFNPDSGDDDVFECGGPWGVRVEWVSSKRIEGAIVQISILNADGIHLTVFGTHIDNFELDIERGPGSIECVVEELPFLLDNYYVTVGIYGFNKSSMLDYWNGATRGHNFKVTPNEVSRSMAHYKPICSLRHDWRRGGVS